jgi:hypothetical protein
MALIWIVVVLAVGWALFMKPRPALEGVRPSSGSVSSSATPAPAAPLAESATPAAPSEKTAGAAPAEKVWDAGGPAEVAKMDAEGARTAK